MQSKPGPKLAVVAGTVTVTEASDMDGNSEDQVQPLSLLGIGLRSIAELQLLNHVSSGVLQLALP